MYYSNITSNATINPLRGPTIDLAPSLLTNETATKTAKAISEANINLPASCKVTQPTATSALNSTLFPYYIPYNTLQTCDIYGPTCQTGNITVKVSIHGCVSATTTLPCSSYLSSQAQYLHSFIPNVPSNGTLPWDWQKGYGRSPQCRSYERALTESVPFTLSGCPADKILADWDRTTAAPIPPMYPPAPDDDRHTSRFECCGKCNIHAPILKVYYFPDPNAESYCRNKGLRVGFAGDPAQSNTVPDVLVSPANGTVAVGIVTAPPITTAVIGSVTMISPSIYISFGGELAVGDRCGRVGRNYSSTLLAFAPEDVSTWRLPSLTASKSGGKNVVPGLTSQAPLTIADLECPSLGVSPRSITRSISSNQRNWEFVYGSPYHALVAQLSQILTFDPTWSSICTAVDSIGPAEHVGLLDPARVLNAAAVLAAPTPATGSGKPDPVVAPVQKAEDDRPQSTQRTGDPGAQKVGSNPLSGDDSSEKGLGDSKGRNEQQKAGDSPSTNMGSERARLKDAQLKENADPGPACGSSCNNEPTESKTSPQPQAATQVESGANSEIDNGDANSRARFSNSFFRLSKVKDGSFGAGNSGQSSSETGSWPAAQDVLNGSLGSGTTNNPSRQGSEEAEFSSSFDTKYPFLSGALKSLQNQHTDEANDNNSDEVGKAGDDSSKSNYESTGASVNHDTDNKAYPIEANGAQGSVLAGSHLGSSITDSNLHSTNASNEGDGDEIPNATLDRTSNAVPFERSATATNIPPSSLSDTELGFGPLINSAHTSSFPTDSFSPYVSDFESPSYPAADSTPSVKRGADDGPAKNADFAETVPRAGTNEWKGVGQETIAQTGEAAGRLSRAELGGVEG
ncbi:uncharacterized protein KY384_004964 [Bacidia gigantensis]|uniref:uncharacterized protein n=1 Tax=Bacidia gigantensis TaxID=2732470 RepID=UPI001D056CC0|nr:uncharacterized protein KY384_004964 [Bacidia gigantensis]KAG8530461.1 hypothetical protein KY384_004964 [Bacidia gigantensis]